MVSHQPIACLLLMVKLLSEIVTKSMYKHLGGVVFCHMSRWLASVSANVLHNRLIKKTVLIDYNTRDSKLDMPWVDYHKAYDMILYSWNMECVTRFGLTLNVERLRGKSMAQ